MCLNLSKTATKCINYQGKNLISWTTPKQTSIWYNVQFLKGESEDRVSENTQ